MTRVATIQMVSGSDTAVNLAVAADLIDRAAAEGAELVVLPEYFPVISDDERAKFAVRESYGNGPIQQFLSDQARTHKLWLMAGSIPLDSGDPNRVYNSCLFYNPVGQAVARYDKIHLFDVQVESAKREVYKESTTIAAGNEVVVASTPFARIGMSICYDLRFPELYRQMLAEDVRIITVPSAFTWTTGQRHWELLLRARAVENLCFVIASNQGGQNTSRRRTWGHSMIIDPWGEILAVIEEGPGIACADIDLAGLESLRQSFPALEHRKL